MYDEPFTIKTKDYVIDDMAQRDKNLRKPTYSDFETVEYPGTYFAYTTTDYDAYDDAYDRYQEKENRDEIRAKLGSTISLVKSSLSYYDGEKVIPIAENVCYLSDWSEQREIVLYNKYESSEIPKVKLSEAGPYDSISDLIGRKRKITGQFLSVGEKEINVEQTDGYQFILNEKGDHLYFLDNYSSDDRKGELINMTIGADDIEKTDVIDMEVYDYRLRNNGSDFLYYFKDNEEETFGVGDLYQDGRLIASDMSIFDTMFAEDENTLLYLADYDSDANSGTLTAVRDGKTTEIADGVTEFIVYDSDAVAFFTDYDKDTKKGDLHFFNGKQETIIDTNVTSIVPDNSNLW
jgi:hypothetical protein